MLRLRPIAAAVACAGALAACGGDDAQVVAPTTTAPARTATTADATSTTPPAGATTTTTGEAAERCASPEGFSLAVPPGWVTNPGDVVARCTLLHPEPFDVPEGTDERVAAIAAHVDPVPFAEVAAPDPARDADRAVTVVDGLQAVRLTWTATGEGLWPEGTPITTYAVDLSPGVDTGPGTLLLDTVGLPGFDHDRNQEVLDQVARSVEVTLDAVPDAPGVVARYEGGGGAFRVVADVRGDEACLRVPPEGPPACGPLPGPSGATLLAVEDLQPVLAGVTGPDVAAVRAQLDDGSTSTYLPVPVPGSDVAGFAFAFPPQRAAEVVLLGHDRTELGTLEPPAP